MDNGGLSSAVGGCVWLVSLYCRQSLPEISESRRKMHVPKRKEIGGRACFPAVLAYDYHEA